MLKPNFNPLFYGKFILMTGLSKTPGSNPEKIDLNEAFKNRVKKYIGGLGYSVSQGKKNKFGSYAISIWKNKENLGTVYLKKTAQGNEKIYFRGNVDKKTKKVSILSFLKPMLNKVEQISKAKQKVKELKSKYGDEYIVELKQGKYWQGHFGIQFRRRDIPESKFAAIWWKPGSTIVYSWNTYKWGKIGKNVNLSKTLRKLKLEQDKRLMTKQELIQKAEREVGYIAQQLGGKYLAKVHRSIISGKKISIRFYSKTNPSQHVGAIWWEPGESTFSYFNWAKEKWQDKGTKLDIKGVKKELDQNLESEKNLALLKAKTETQRLKIHFGDKYIVELQEDKYWKGHFGIQFRRKDMPNTKFAAIWWKPDSTILQKWDIASWKHVSRSDNADYLGMEMSKLSEQVDRNLDNNKDLISEAESALKEIKKQLDPQITCKLHKSILANGRVAIRFYGKNNPKKALGAIWWKPGTDKFPAFAWKDKEWKKVENLSAKDLSKHLLKEYKEIGPVKPKIKEIKIAKGGITIIGEGLPKGTKEIKINPSEASVNISKGIQSGVQDVNLGANFGKIDNGLKMLLRNAISAAIATVKGIDGNKVMSQIKDDQIEALKKATLDKYKPTIIARGVASREGGFEANKGIAIARAESAKRKLEAKNPGIKVVTSWAIQGFGKKEDGKALKTQAEYKADEKDMINRWNKDFPKRKVKTAGEIYAKLKKPSTWKADEKLFFKKFFIDARRVTMAVKYPKKTTGTQIAMNFEKSPNVVG